MSEAMICDINNITLNEYKIDLEKTHSLIKEEILGFFEQSIWSSFPKISFLYREK